MDIQRQNQSVQVVDKSSSGAVRRAIETFAKKLEFDDTQRGRIALAVTEGANNIALHGNGGYVLFKQLDADFGNGIEVLFVDKGPGMHNISECFQDGFSTGGTMGQGLGAIRRNVDSYEIFSSRDRGTVLLARIGKTQLPTQRQFSYGAVSIAVEKEFVCGDSWAVRESGDKVFALVVDGLGHGPGAAEAAQAAVDCFMSVALTHVTEVLERIHLALRKTRGAAASVIELDRKTNELNYAGIGNISAVILDPEMNTRSLVSLSGIAGVEARKIQAFNSKWCKDSTIVMHSDGLMSRWDLTAYPGLIRKDPTIIAAVLARDFSRGKDDVTVLVLSTRRATAS